MVGAREHETPQEVTCERARSGAHEGRQNPTLRTRTETRTDSDGFERAESAQHGARRQYNFYSTWQRVDGCTLDASDGQSKSRLFETVLGFVLGRMDGAGGRLTGLSLSVCLSSWLWIQSHTP